MTLPFNIPGYRWDAERNRYFKLDPGVARLAGSTTTTQKQPGESAQQRGRHGKKGKRKAEPGTGAQAGPSSAFPSSANHPPLTGFPINLQALRSGPATRATALRFQRSITESRASRFRLRHVQKMTSDPSRGTCFTRMTADVTSPDGTCLVASDAEQGLWIIDTKFRDRELDPWPSFRVESGEVDLEAGPISSLCVDGITAMATTIGPPRCFFVIQDVSNSSLKVGTDGWIGPWISDSAEDFGHFESHPGGHDLRCSAFLNDPKRSRDDKDVREQDYLNYLIVLGVDRKVMLPYDGWQSGCDEIHLASDVLAVELAYQGDCLLVGTRSGKVLAYDLDAIRRQRNDRNDRSRRQAERSRTSALRGRVFAIPDVPVQLQLSNVKGAVTNIKMVSEHEFVVAYTSGEMFLCDLRSLAVGPSLRYEGHVNSFTFNLGFAVDPVHRLLACAGQDQRIRIWSLDSPFPLVTQNRTRSQSADNNPSPSLQHIGTALADQIFLEPVQCLAWCAPSDSMTPPDDIESPETRGFPALAVAWGTTIFYYE